MAIATDNVQGRRTLQFHNLQEVLSDVDRLASGGHECLGNWSLGEICDHLAKAFHASIDGNLEKVPLWLRVAGRWVYKPRVLTRPMPAAIRLPKQMEPLLPEPTDTSAGVAALHRAVERYQRETRRAPHPVFGPLTPDEWDSLHLRHCALHLSFARPLATA